MKFLKFKIYDSFILKFFSTDAKINPSPQPHPYTLPRLIMNKYLRSLPLDRNKTPLIRKININVIKEYTNIKTDEKGKVGG